MYGCSHTNQKITVPCTISPSHYYYYYSHALFGLCRHLYLPTRSWHHITHTHSPLNKQHIIVAAAVVVDRKKPAFCSKVK